MKTKIYNFKLCGIQKNPQFESNVLLMDKNGLTDESLRSCLINNNADKNYRNTGYVSFSKRANRKAIQYVKQKRRMLDNYEEIYFLQKEPKWLFTFYGNIVDTETGEIFENLVYQQDDVEMAIKRKRKAIKSFTDFYEPLYQAKKVSCLFFTLTQANQSDQTIRVAIDLIKKRFERHNQPILGSIWVSEVSQNNHWHYHLAIATKRVYWKKIPKWAKVDDLWGRRTGIEFIKKSIGAYLSKYIGKNNIGRMMNFRSYGKSRNFQNP